ncbi:NUDIX domain-containing protein [Bacillus infantis]|uniref:NUDIX hydrolase n=1 Tax=Bacillus infantis TaxID=324767 RepID=UPI001CD77946|nr:NUDIX domain-containing protein [Bacillus infantis]MCA1041879.1 NUDIX domain-containing protein [Bacillus infantis]
MDSILIASTAVLMDGRLLMIKEHKNEAGPTWNFPSGHVEPGEDIIAAARRETKEETGLDIKIAESAGIFQFTSRTGHPILLFQFLAEFAGGSIKLENGITEYSWFTAREILDMDESMLREPGVIRQIARSILKQSSIPLSFFHNLS